MQFSKLIVAMIIALNIGFTAAVLYVFLRVGSEPTSGIKREKLRRGNDEGLH